MRCNWILLVPISLLASLNWIFTLICCKRNMHTHTHTHTHMHIECAPFLHSPIEYSPLQAQQLWLHLVRVPTRLARPEALAVRRIRWGRGLKVYATPSPQADTALHTRTQTNTRMHALTASTADRAKERGRERGKQTRRQYRNFVYCRDLPKIFALVFGFAGNV